MQIPRTHATAFEPVRTRRAALFLVAALACLTLAAGCAGMGRQSVETTEGMSTQRLLMVADSAYAHGEFHRSELYYQRTLERVDLSPAERLLGTRRLAESAAQAGHPRQALEALQGWAALDPAAPKDATYTALKMAVLGELGHEDELGAEANRILGSTDMAWSERARLGALFGRVLLERDQAADAVRFWDKLYARGKSGAERGELERNLYRVLTQTPDLEPLERQATPETAGRFPLAVARFEQGRRIAAKAGNDTSASVRGTALMQDVLLRSNLEDKAFFGDILASLGGGQGGGAGLRVALAVPITGKYAEIGQKIARGAGAAQWQLAASGLDLEIRVINTDAEGWVQRLAALPGEWSLVGGPLTVEGFKSMADAGVVKRRAVFSFLPGLGDYAEGRDAWRFFSSREDEVRALLDLCIRQLGITRFGVLAPEEDFGSRMSEVFTRMAMIQGGSVTGSATYPPGEHTEWGRRVARALGVPATIDKHKVMSAPRFGAVFLPDGWNQAQLLVPNFFYYDASDMVYLGPNLWSRSLDQVRDVELNYFRLAVCPGAWWPETSGAEALQAELDAQGLGTADYWVALGYDFTRMASVLGPLPAAPTASEVNQRLARVASMTFSMAPVSYTADGVAMQRQYLFAPGADGKRLANPDDLRQGIQRAQNLRAHRKEQMNKTQP